ncbi:MAG: dTDP-4-dehydrorhamnose 3,5-epimerase family protein [Methylovulum sp.]|jgi:dTDP-4-dehydrorhamnose 3,5-epimerase|nr:dTDP-4-dehydrorhamnose 3,5-epimerase family protein [Methylovulum sp.]MCF7997775.1 dTDP-4-dehydrorhamnose 3,5-epimerase family protein [Methylovulum sp.]
MNRLLITDLPLSGLKRITRQPLGDARGFFSRLFCAEELTSAGWCKPMAQTNFSFTAQQGTVRGLHYQNPPDAEMKLISCQRGKIWDVAVDLRADSPTFLHWYAEILSADNHLALLIPEGFAHGFQTLTDNCELLYFNSANYVPSSEGGLRSDDPILGIKWPIPVTLRSERDQEHPLLTTQFSGINL